MKIKNYKEWDYTLILVALMFLIAFLTSCSNSKIVYRMGNSWKPAAERSEVTGWEIFYTSPSTTSINWNIKDSSAQSATYVHNK